MKGHLLAEDAVEGVLRVGNRPQCRRIAEFTKQVRCNLTRSVGLYARDTVRQGLKPNDTLRILRQELKSGNGRQKVNAVEAGDGRVQSGEIVDGWSLCAHAKKVPLHHQYSDYMSRKSAILITGADSAYSRKELTLVDGTSYAGQTIPCQQQ
jgi:hypothetical protein